MRRLQVRVSIRALMLLIALVAMSIEAEIIRRRWTFHGAKAAEFGKLENGMLWLAGKEEAKAAEAQRKVEEFEGLAQVEHYPYVREGWLANAAGRRQSAATHTREAADLRLISTEYGHLRRLHETAAAHPWLQYGPIVGPRSTMELRAEAAARRIP